MKKRAAAACALLLDSLALRADTPLLALAMGLGLNAVAAILLPRMLPRLHKGSGRFGWGARHWVLTSLATLMVLAGLVALAIYAQSVEQGNSAAAVPIAGAVAAWIVLFAAGFALSVLSEAWWIYGRVQKTDPALLATLVKMNLASYLALLAPALLVLMIRR